jgi:hypothetical protein
MTKVATAARAEAFQHGKGLCVQGEIDDGTVRPSAGIA